MELTMRQAMLGFCVLAAACSSQPVSPTAASAVASVAGTQTQARGGGNVQVTFTKWIDPAFPAFAGVAGGDVPGAFAATVLRRTPFDNGNIIQLEARYEVIGDDPAHSFVALIEGTQITQTQRAVLNGTVIEGWLTGAQVHVTFDVIRPCPQFDKPACFSGVIRVMPGSAD
jgi:hypothetical protein